MASDEAMVHKTLAKISVEHAIEAMGLVVWTLGYVFDLVLKGTSVPIPKPPSKPPIQGELNQTMCVDTSFSGLPLSKDPRLPVGKVLGPLGSFSWDTIRSPDGFFVSWYPFKGHSRFKVPRFDICPTGGLDRKTSILSLSHLP